jgi:hypothetical protein
MALALNPQFNWARYGGNALQDIGVGLTQAPTFFGGLAAGAQRNAALQPDRDAAAQAEQDRKTQLLEKNQTSEWIKDNFPQYANLPPAQAWQAAMGDLQAQRNASSGSPNLPASIQEYQFYADQARAAGQAPKLYDEWRQGSNQTVRAGLGQPVPLRNKVTGETVPFMPMSDGTYMNPLSQTVADQNWEFDPAYIQAQKSQGAAVGTAVGNTQFNLPAARQNVDLEIANIDAILADKEGLSQTFGNLGGVSVNGIGFPNQWTPTLPNTPKANLQERVKQVVGQNFLQAFSSLKGAGAITEVEGTKAQEAMARLGSAQDQKSFEQALNDLKAVLQLGYNRMQQQAGTLPSVGGTSTSGNRTSTGVTWSVTP